MDTSMQRGDLDEGLSTLITAYKEATEELDGKDPSADRFVHDLLQTWREVSTDDFRFADELVQHVITDEKSVSAYKETVNDLAQAIRQYDSRNVVLLAGNLLGILTNYLKKVQQLLNEQRGSRTPADQNNRRTVELLVARLEQMELSQQLREAAQLARTAVAEAQKAATDAKTAAGVAAGANLTERFEALAKRHFVAATLFRILTAVGVLGGIWGTLQISDPDTTTAEAILRVSLLAGVLGLATYFGRQAAYHRDVSTWASTIKAQLLTFEGYTEPVKDTDMQDQMRVAFAARVFGSSPETKDEPAPTLTSDLLAAIAKLGSPSSK